MYEQRSRVLSLTARGIAGAAAVIAIALAATTCKRAPTPVTTTGAVEGQVVLAGERPEPRSIKVAGCPTWTKMWKDRGESPPDPAWMVHETGGLPNAFVWAEEGPHVGVDYSADLGETEVVLIIDHYFFPRVFGVMVDQEVKIANEDKGLFTIPLSFSNDTERLIELPGGRSHPFSFPAPEKALSIKPKKHSWLQAWAFVLEHPFHAVTDDSGRFRIEGLPAGEYAFHAWHETFGEVEFKAQVAGGEVFTADVTLQQK